MCFREESEREEKPMHSWKPQDVSANAFKEEEENIGEKRAGDGITQLATRPAESEELQPRMHRDQSARRHPFCSFFLDIPAMVGLTFHEDGLRPTFLAAQNLTDASASATN